MGGGGKSQILELETRKRNPICFVYKSDRRSKGAITRKNGTEKKNIGRDGWKQKGYWKGRVAEQRMEQTGGITKYGREG